MLKFQRETYTIDTGLRTETAVRYVAQVGIARYTVEGEKGYWMLTIQSDSRWITTDDQIGRGYRTKRETIAIANAYHDLGDSFDPATHGGRTRFQEANRLGYLKAGVTA